MQENNFQNLEIFEAPVLNEYCDILVKNVREITGENLYLVDQFQKF